VTGILAGQTTPTTQTFVFGSAVDHARQCERFALIALSRPGKYQLAIGSNVFPNKAACKLILRTP
jgi:hypothetical protein